MRIRAKSIHNGMPGVYTIPEGEETRRQRCRCSTSPERERRKAERNIMVITLDKRKRPLGHCTEKRARKLMEARRAVVHRYYPFTIIIKDIDAREVKANHEYRIKIDPGAKHTGIAVVDKDKAILFMQIKHRGDDVVDLLGQRNSNRRNRRNRETHYRHPKCQKGAQGAKRPEGWLPPSQRSISDNVIHWVKRLIRWLGPCAVSLEGVKFDMQIMENPDIEGAQYQQGTLFGYEIKEYLKEKYQCICQYCAGTTEDHRLEWEHKLPKSRGGSGSVKNATLACHTCNQAKGGLTPQEWLAAINDKKHKSELDKKRVECLGKICQGKVVGKKLRYAAWVNTQRWHLWNALKSLPGVMDFEWSTGGRTAYNRSKLGLEKDHHIDALCVGKKIPENGFHNINQRVLYIEAMGRGKRFIGQCNKCGIITVKYHDHHKVINGLQTGDIVKISIPNGKYAGAYKGRVMVRSSGSHDVRCFDKTLVTGTKKSVYKVLQHADGYSYSYSA